MSIEKKVTAVLGGITIACWYGILAALWGLFFAAQAFERMFADLDAPLPHVTKLVLQSAAWGRSGLGLGFLTILAIASAAYYAAAPRKWSTIIVFGILGMIPLAYMLGAALALSMALIQITNQMR